MFEIGWTEMLVIAIVMIVVVGPKDLPKMLRTFGKFTSKMTSMAGDFRKQFDEALKEAELDDVRKSVNDLRSLNPTNEIRKAFNPMEKAAADVRAGMDSLMRPKTSVPTPPASTEPVASEPLKAGPTAEPGGLPVAEAPAVSAPGIQPIEPRAIEPTPPAAPVAASPTLAASPAPSTVIASAPVSIDAASMGEPSVVKKPRAPRVAKVAATEGAAVVGQAKPKPAPKAAKPITATAGLNGVAVDKPVRSRKPKETGTAT